MKTAIIYLSAEFEIGNVRQKMWRIPVVDDTTIEDVEKHIHASVALVGAVATIKSIEFEAISEE